MKRITPLLAAIVATISTSALAADQTLTFTGLGPVRIGMTLAQAEAALGTKLQSVVPGLASFCWVGNRADGIDSPVSYMIDNQKIVRIEISDKTVPPVISEQGIRIDSSLDDVKEAYGSRVSRSQANAGDEHHQDMQVLSDDTQYGLLLEIWDGKVKNFRVGTAAVFRTNEPCGI